MTSDIKRKKEGSNEETSITAIQITRKKMRLKVAKFIK